MRCRFRCWKINARCETWRFSNLQEIYKITYNVNICGKIRLTRVQTGMMKPTRTRRGLSTKWGGGVVRGDNEGKFHETSLALMNASMERIIQSLQRQDELADRRREARRLDATKTAGAKTEKGKSRERCLPRAFHHSRRATCRNAYAPRAKPDAVPARVIRAR